MAASRLPVDERTESFTAALKYDPFAPEEFARLRGLSRRIALRRDVPSDVGEEVLGKVLERYLELRDRPTTSIDSECEPSLRDRRPRPPDQWDRAYVLRGVMNGVIDVLRRSAFTVALPDEHAFTGDLRTGASRKRREALLEASQSISELERMLERELLALLPAALETLDEQERAAWCARLRQSLERVDAGLVEVLRESAGVDLGPYVGYLALAEARGLSPGTVASQASRAQAKVTQWFRRINRRRERPAPGGAAAPETAARRAPWS